MPLGMCPWQHRPSPFIDCLTIQPIEIEYESNPHQDHWVDSSLRQPEGKQSHEDRDHQKQAKVRSRHVASILGQNLNSAKSR